MRYILFLCVFVFSLTLKATDNPNILLIFTDDMGFSDIGCYGSEIQTPYIDSLAANGIRFSKFYNCAKCVPSRSCILTGVYP